MYERCFKTFAGYTRYIQSVIQSNHTAIPVRFLKDSRGAVLSVEFLILIPIILFLLFGGTDYFVTQIQQDQMEHLKSYYLDRMKIEGTLTYEDQLALYTKLTEKGYSNIEILALDAYGQQLDSSTRIIRNINDPESSKLILKIIATPQHKPFLFGKLIGVTLEEDFYFCVGGETLSEQPQL